MTAHVRETYTEDGSLGGAVLGGLVARDIGSYLGATRGRYYICSYIIEINRRNIQSPVFQIVLFENAKIDANSAEYIEAVKFSTEIKGIINAIICGW